MTQETNPYRPPMSEAVSVNETRVSEPAGKGRRFGTLLVDSVCILACVGVGNLVLAVVVVAYFGEEGINFHGHSGMVLNIFQIALNIFQVICYYAFFEGIWARTPGKLIFGTIVVNEAGRKPSFGQVLKRTFCRFIPFEPVSFFGTRGWHDSLSNTCVVRKRKPQLGDHLTVRFASRR